MKKSGLLFLCLFLGSCFIPCQAAYVLKNGRLSHVDQVATRSVSEHFEIGMQALAAKDWKEASRQFQIVSVNFPNSSYGQEAFYHLGVAYFFLEEFDFSNEAFSSYLKNANNPQYFQETVEYKYAIAERFKAGAKRRFLGTKQLPKWASGKSMALKIYDEVIATVPSHEISAQALISKGSLLWEMNEYRECIEAFQMVIKRFPKSEYAPECYVLITQVFLDQSQYEFQNPDILAFALINLRKFKQDFPKEERLVEAENMVLSIKEIYANGLFETGQFYERTEKPNASMIYYRNAIKQFPETQIAELCRKRLEILDPREQVQS